MRSPVVALDIDKRPPIPALAVPRESGDVVPLVRWGLAPSQLWFLQRHACDKILPVQWQWNADETRLTVRLDNGVRGTISASHFHALCRLGLIERIGCAGAKITDLGRRCIA